MPFHFHVLHRPEFVDVDVAVGGGFGILAGVTLERLLQEDGRAEWVLSLEELPARVKRNFLLNLHIQPRPCQVAPLIPVAGPILQGAPAPANGASVAA